MRNQDVLLSELKLNTEMHIRYVELLTKINVYYYAATGALIAFHFSNAKDAGNNMLDHVLWLPLLWSMGLAGLMIYSYPLAVNLRNSIKDLSGKIDSDFYLEGSVLVSLCVFSGLMFVVSASLLGFYMFSASYNLLVSSKGLASIGLVMDLVGVVLIWQGVRITRFAAQDLEQPVIPSTIDDIGGEAMAKMAELVSKKRVRERMRPDRWTKIGLVFLIAGFSLQLCALYI